VTPTYETVQATREFLLLLQSGVRGEYILIRRQNQRPRPLASWLWV
jgi:hypothetical protein